MYAIRTEGMVALTRHDDFLAWVQRSQDFLQAQSGFQARRVLNSRGYPGKYTGMWYFDSQEAANAIAFSAGWRNFLQANPLAGIWTETHPARAYDVAVDIGKGSTGDISQVMLAELTTNPNVSGGEFVKIREELFTLLQKHERSLVRSRLLRFLGGGGHYLAIHAFAGDSAEMTALQSIPEVTAFYQKHPNSTYLTAPPAGESYVPVRIAVAV